MLTFSLLCSIVMSSLTHKRKFLVSLRQASVGPSAACLICELLVS